MRIHDCRYARLGMLSVFVPFWQRVVSKESTVSSALCTKSPRGEEEEEETRASIFFLSVSVLPCFTTIGQDEARQLASLQTKTIKLACVNVPLTVQAPASVDAGAARSKCGVKQAATYR